MKEPVWEGYGVLARAAFFALILWVVAIFAGLYVTDWVHDNWLHDKAEDCLCEQI